VIASGLDAVPDCFVNRLRVVIRKVGVAQNQITPGLANCDCRPRFSLGFGRPRDDGVFFGSFFVFVRFTAMVTDEVACRFKRRKKCRVSRDKIFCDLARRSVGCLRNGGPDYVGFSHFASGVVDKTDGLSVWPL
jgi:hypothetical protein